MKTITCVNEQCGIDFSVPEGWKKQRHQSGKQFYCPNGHPMSYPVGKSEADKLKEELAESNRQLERSRDYGRSLSRQRDTAQASASSYKGHVTRLKNKANAET